MKPYFATLSAIALGMTGTLAVAHNHMEGHDPDTDGDGNITRAELTAHADAMFARMDANGDGVLDAQDRSAHRHGMFAKADTNGDGELSRDEMKAAHEARMERRKQRMEARAERMEDHFARMDTDGSGGVSPEEMKAMHRAHGEGHGQKRRGHRMRGHGGALMMMRMADTDNDKSVTRAEFDAAVAAHFAKADADGDGVVTKAERKTAHEAMRAMHKQKHQAHED